MYHTYVLLSENDGKQYVGYTKDLKLRFEPQGKKFLKGRLKSYFTGEDKNQTLLFYSLWGEAH